jgi:hypothetical protein
MSSPLRLEERVRCRQALEQDDDDDYSDDDDESNIPVL